MPEINPLTKDQLFEKKIAENTGSNYNVGDISDVVPVTKDQSLLKEIALNSAGLSEAIEAMVNVLGSKNLAPILDFTQKVDYGITWTVIRENGSNNGKVSVVGTSSGWSTVETKDFYLPAGTYVISDGASSRNTYVELKKSSDASVIVNTFDEDSKTFTLSEGTLVYGLYVVKAGVTVDGVFYYMIRDARITDSTYVPYAMTNRELTEICSDIPSHLFVDKNDSIISDFDNLPYGFYCGNVDNTSNHCPDVNGSAFLIFTVGGRKTNNFKIQLAVSYATNKSYIRYCWATWSDWQQISN